MKGFSAKKCKMSIRKVIVHPWASSSSSAEQEQPDGPTLVEVVAEEPTTVPAG